MLDEADREKGPDVLMVEEVVEQRVSLVDGVALGRVDESHHLRRVAEGVRRWAGTMRERDGRDLVGEMEGAPRATARARAVDDDGKDGARVEQRGGG